MNFSEDWDVGTLYLSTKFELDRSTNNGDLLPDRNHRDTQTDRLNLILSPYIGSSNNGLLKVNRSIIKTGILRETLNTQWSIATYCSLAVHGGIPEDPWPYNSHSFVGGVYWFCMPHITLLLVFLGEQDGRVVRTPAFGSEGPRFDPRQQPLVQLS